MNAQSRNPIMAQPDKGEELLPCPICGCEMEHRGDFTHNPSDGIWTSHPFNACILAGMWFNPEKWNRRVPPADTGARKDLNHELQLLCESWAKDDRKWNTQNMVEESLYQFGKILLKLTGWPAQTPSTREEGEE